MLKYLYADIVFDTNANLSFFSDFFLTVTYGFSWTWLIKFDMIRKTLNEWFGKLNDNLSTPIHYNEK